MENKRYHNKYIYILYSFIILTCKCDGSKDLMKKYHGNEQLVNGIVESKDMVMGFFILCTETLREGERERDIIFRPSR